MSKESYARGFCKAAEAHGVDPTQLAKYAKFELPQGFDYTVSEVDPSGEVQDFYATSAKNPSAVGSTNRFINSFKKKGPGRGTLRMTGAKAPQNLYRNNIALTR